MSRVVLAGAAALWLLTGCAEERSEPVGIRTRLFVDRAESSVGDRVGVTVEIETPPGFSVQPPGAPANTGFSTESVELLEPLERDGTVHHRLLWTLRARDVGEQALPQLQIPLVHPDGRIQPLPVGGVPLTVTSVRSELPEREVFFDIREPPPAAPSRAPLYLGSGVALVLALLGALVWRHRRDAAAAGPDPLVAARAALAQLEAARAIADARLRAAREQTAVWSFVEACFDVPAATTTPDELPERVDEELAAVLALFERQRFARSALADSVEAAGTRARAALRAIAGHVERA